MTTIVERFTSALEEAIAERGADYHYKVPEGGDCAYANPDGTPSCGVGLAVAKLDPEMFEAIARYEARDGTFGASVLASAEWTGRAGVPLLPGVQKLSPAEAARFAAAMEAFQSAQDKGYAWGEAYEAYEAVLQGEGVSTYDAVLELSDRYTPEPVDPRDGMDEEYDEYY